MHEQKGIITEMETIRKNVMEIRNENRVKEMMNVFDRTISRLDTDVERISILEDKSIEMPRVKTKRKKIREWGKTRPEHQTSVDNKKKV